LIRPIIAEKWRFSAIISRTACAEFKEERAAGFSPETEVRSLVRAFLTTDYTDYADFFLSMGGTILSEVCFSEPLQNLCSLCNLWFDF
jgi:hypothetical protein